MDTSREIVIIIELILASLPTVLTVIVQIIKSYQKYRIKKIQAQTEYENNHKVRELEIKVASLESKLGSDDS